MMISLLGKKIYKGGFLSAETAASYFDALSINVFGLNVSLTQDSRLEPIEHIHEVRFRDFWRLTFIS